MDKSRLYDKALVTKRNVLNELRSNNMTLQELRFFSIYLSKINPMDKSTRAVRFSLDDFRRIMELGSDMNILHFKCAIRRILQQIVEIPNESGSGYTAFQLFKRAKLEKDEQNEWYVELDAHDEALPLMFDFKERYFKYELWNALRLKSPNQLRMYEILKQYETLGRRELAVTDLRELLGIEKNEYQRWERFKIRVLDACQQALQENTDICYTYERGKTGRGGKWLTIIFKISKNKHYVDQLSLKDFIANQKETVSECPQYSNEYIAMLAEACNNEFSEEQMQFIFQLVKLHDDELPYNENGIWCARFDYLTQKYAELNCRENIKNRFGYFCKMIAAD